MKKGENHSDPIYTNPIKNLPKHACFEGAAWNFLRFDPSGPRLSFCECPGKIREAPVRFGSVTVRGWNGSSGSDFRFRQFLQGGGFSVFQYSSKGKDGSGSGFGSLKTVPAVPVPLSVSGKTVPTVPVSGSGSVPEPP